MVDVLDVVQSRDVFDQVCDLLKIPEDERALIQTLKLELSGDYPVILTCEKYIKKDTDNVGE